MSFHHVLNRGVFVEYPLEMSIFGCIYREMHLFFLTSVWMIIEFAEARKKLDFILLFIFYFLFFVN